MAVQQNLQTTSMDVQGMRGTRVQLVWKREHEFQVTHDGAVTSTAAATGLP